MKLQLEWIAEGGSQAGVPAPVAVRRRSRERLAWGIVAGLGVLALALGSLLLLRRPEPPTVTRFEVGVPRGASNIAWPQLSPDGRSVAMQVTDSTGVVRIWIRPFDSLEGHPLGGTEGASRPFWSPDSRFLAYIVGGKLRKAPVDGGPPTTIADASGGADGSWGTRGVILFDGGGADSIRAVPASGGAVRAATVKNRRAGDVQHSWPQFLPDGRHFLYIAANSGSASEGAIQVGDLDSKTTRVLGRTDGRVQYSDGYLLFPREGTLMAQPFDLRSLRTTGDPVPVAEHVTMGNANGHFTAAAGALAYRIEESADNNQLVWMDRTGHVTPTTAPPAAYRDLAISPDGRRVAVAIGSGSHNNEDIWVRDLTRGVNTRLTFGQGNNIWPVWSPDGSRIAYCSDRAGDFRVLICSAGGEGGLDSVAHAPEGSDGPVSWSPDGRTLLVTRFEGSDWNLLAFPAQGGGKPAPFVHTPYIERWAQFSPDGHWAAYTSNESGRNELYVTGYPGPSGKWQISTAGGSEGFWRGDGKELVYRAPDGTIMAAPIQTGAAVEVGTPVPLFKVTPGTGGFSRNRWAPTPDGQRFLVNTPVANSGGGRFIVVTH